MGKIPYEKKDVNLLVGEHKSPAYLKINPRGVVPAIKDRDFVLTESNAILKYLVESRKELPDTLFPKDPIKRSEVDEILEWY